MKIGIDRTQHGQNTLQGRTWYQGGVLQDQHVKDVVNEEYTKREREREVSSITLTPKLRVYVP
jgi:hypothetical protein